MQHSSSYNAKNEKIREFSIKVRPYYATRHTAAQCGKPKWQELISMGSKNDVHACVSTLQVTFLGDVFQLKKNVWVTKNSVIVSPGTEHTCIRKKYKHQLLITAQYSCSRRQNNTRISSVQIDTKITHKQSAVFSTTEKSVDEQSWHQCRAASLDGTDNLPIKFLDSAASNGMPQPSRRSIHIYLRHGPTFAARPCRTVLLCVAWHCMDVP